MLIDKKLAPKRPFTRRRFIKGIAAASIITMAPWMTACQADSKNDQKSTSKKLELVAAAVLGILIPDDHFGPSAKDIQSNQYLKWLLHDNNYDADIQNNIRKGLQYLVEFSSEQTGKNFVKLTPSKQKEIIAKAMDIDWGRTLFSRLLSVSLDAFVIDPIYGMNQKEAGWKWLNHIPGLPRPNEQNKYPNLLARKKENKIISQLTDL